MEIKLLKTEKSTATVDVIVSSAEVQEEEQHTLTHLAAETTIKGFRKGKAPINLVKNSLDPEKLRQKTVGHLLSHAVEATIKEHKLKVIAHPRLIAEDTKTDTWSFTLEFPLYPTLELGEYQEKIKAALAKKKPVETTEDKTKDKDDQKLKVVFDTLLDTIQIDIAQALIDEEVNHSLGRLVSQTESLNLSMADYLKSINKTPEQLRNEYTKTATDSLKLDFILFAIAKNLNLTVSEEEVKSFQGAAQTKSESRPYLESVLLKRKAVDSLLKL